MLLEILVGLFSLCFMMVFITACRAKEAGKKRRVLMAVFGVLTLYNVIAHTLQMFYVASVLMIIFSSMMILRANDVAVADRCYEKLKDWWRRAPYIIEGKNRYGLWPLPKENHAPQQSHERMYLPDGTPLIPIDDNQNPVYGDHDGNTRIFRKGEFE